MRPIKFRCWDKEYKCMNCQGDPDLETLQSFIFHYGDQELMQFTGLYDKDEKEIYEGDILEYVFEYYGETYEEVVKKGYIKCINGSFVFYILRDDEDEEWYSLSDLNYDPNSVEIIGNIHEYKHLLEEC